MAQAGGRRHQGLAIGLGIAVLLTMALVVAMLLWPRDDAARQGTAALRPAPVEAPTPTSTPIPLRYAENTNEYDLEGVPDSEVFSILPDLPTDTDPFGDLPGLTARAASERIPVFADPEGEPVAALRAEQRYGGTTVAVIDAHEHWVHVLLSGRQGLPGEGDPSQITGWVRAADVDIDINPFRVEVHLDAQTIHIIEKKTDGTSEFESLDGPFAWGMPATPTPLGRSFIMLNETVSLEYARGYPMVYLSVQSPTLAHFAGQAQATTAFHYHDAHVGAISNGCIRLGAADMTRLAELPDGTPIYVFE
ncbi:L,D-transpeptidase [Microbacterium amylolyticum]|uniref:L,D-TPase catalytic domain-containing protein n=1 Tax=Microbacterium amylolyticum TaxID=936337 RepID=A0ABS4ZEQ3_9MICO|nr:L,D-transpeptidase [Microbacterium amylolyticum]MBP2435513.1 hypothetical protein [Microbacterium amylolyticum]